MKKLLIVIFIVLVPVLAWSATYTATQNGIGADYSVATFNAATFSSGDIIYFSGQITSQIVPPSDNITLDGYQTNNTTDVVGGDSTSGFAYFDGMASTPISISGRTGVTIRDFRFTDWQASSAAIYVYQSNDTTITNNHLHDGHATLGKRGIWLNGTRALYSIGATITDNLIDGVPDSASVGSGIITSWASDIVISGNVIKNCVDSITLVPGEQVLIEENSFLGKQAESWAEDHIDVKEFSEDVIIRYNKFSDTTMYGVSAIHPQRTAKNVYIYGNYFYNQSIAVWIYGGASCPYAAPDCSGGIWADKTENIHIWSNIFNSCRAAVRTLNSSYGQVDLIYTYGNTIANCFGSTTSSAFVAYQPQNGDNWLVNNVFLDNKNYLGSRWHIHVANSTQAANTTAEYNIGWNTDGDARAYWISSGVLFEAVPGDNLRKNPNLDEELRPTADSSTTGGATLSDATLPDYANRITIGGETFCNDDGGSCDNVLTYDEGVGMGSVWTTNPPGVVTVMKSDYVADGWVGAYVYGTADLVPPGPSPPGPVVYGATLVNGISGAVVNGLENAIVNGTGGGTAPTDETLTFVASSGTVASSPGTAVSITHGLTIAEGDLVLAYVNSNGTPTISDNNGANSFTEKVEGVAAPSSGAKRAWYWRVAGASEPSSYAWTLSASNNWTVAILQFSPVSGQSIQADPFDVSPSTDMTTGNSANPDAPQITVGSDNSTVICVATRDSSSGTFTSFPSGYSNAYTSHGAIIRPTSIYMKQVDAGAENPSAFTVSSGDWGCEVFSLLPSETP